MIFKDLYDYRELLRSSVKKNIRGKYQKSFLGFLWSFINPLLQVLVYSIVFPLIMKNREPHYIAFLVCGIIPWNFFTSTIHEGTSCIVANAGIIKKIYFPREILPISVAISGLVNFFIQIPIIALFVFFSNIGFSWNFLFFPLIAIVEMFFSLAIVLITSSLCVYMRDLEYIVNFIVNLMFYASAIFYSAEAVAQTEFGFVMKCNPMAVVIANFRTIFIEKTPPDFALLGIIGAASILLCVLGFAIFSKLEKGFAEEV